MDTPNLEAITPTRTTINMVESTWLNIGHFLKHLDPNTRKETRRFERLNMKIIQKMREREREREREKEIERCLFLRIVTVKLFFVSFIFYV